MTGSRSCLRASLPGSRQLLLDQPGDGERPLLEQHRRFANGPQAAPALFIDARVPAPGLVDFRAFGIVRRQAGQCRLMLLDAPGKVLLAVAVAQDAVDDAAPLFVHVAENADEEACQTFLLF